MSTSSGSMTERDADFYLFAAYSVFLGREPDPAGLRHWRAVLLDSAEPLDFVSGVMASGEYLGRTPGDAGLSTRLAAPDALAPDADVAVLVAAQKAQEKRVALLSAWVAHLSQRAAEMPDTTAVSLASLDRLHKDQVALAARLLSIEGDLAFFLAEGERHAARLQAVEAQQATDRDIVRSHDEQLRRMEESLAQAGARDDERDRTLRAFDAALGEVRRPPSGHALTSGTTSQAFEDAGLNLTTGPYGRFLTIVPDLIGGVLERGAFWDPHLEAIITGCANPGLVAIDAGAYIGFHSVFLARHFGHVHSFEPQLRCFRLLNANLELNGCAKVTAYNAPLYEEVVAMHLADRDRQQIPLSFHGDAIDYASIGNAAALAFVPVEDAHSPGLQSMTIDSLGLRDVGFIKIDTQGCDLRVLRGARQTIAACRPTIVFEFEEDLARNHGDTLDDYRRFLDECGYDTTEIAHTGARQWDFLATPAGSR